MSALLIYGFDDDEQEIVMTSDDFHRPTLDAIAELDASVKSSIDKAAEDVFEQFRSRQWQPIETAPPNTYILVYLPWNNLVRMASLNTTGKGGAKIGWKVSFSSGYEPYLENSKPTHWMPLPEPPCNT